MDLRQLKYFVTIVEEGQITKAAKKLHMAQPPLSHQLKMMERELDCMLFDRNGRNLELTQSGKILYERGQKLLSDFEDTLTEVKEVDKGLKGTLSIGVVQTCLSYIPEKLTAIRKKYPDVHFKIIEGDADYLKERLLKREIEIAILDLLPSSKEFSSISLASEFFVLVVPEKWNFKNYIKMSKIKRLPFLILQSEKNKSTNEFILEECRRHGFELNIVCECSDTLMLLSLVHEGVGATILPKTVLNTLTTNNLNIIHIEDCSIQSNPTIIWHNERYLSQNALHFLEFFSEKQQENIS